MLGRLRVTSILKCFLYLRILCGLLSLLPAMVKRPLPPFFSYCLLTYPAISASIEHVPFKHYVVRLPCHADTETVYKAYLRLLDASREVLAKSDEGSRDYNVAMAADWIAVIPRRNSEGPYGANAAGMLGIVYLPDQQERDKWSQLGYTKQLVAFGIPVEA
jgi:ATP adenylyltransferase